MVYEITENIDQHFNILSDITDRVALMNSHYDTDLDGAFDDMEGFIRDAMDWDLEKLPLETRQSYFSHMTFYREVIAEIIAEARRLLIGERRPYLKRLVAFHKDFMKWLSQLEKNYAA